MYELLINDSTIAFNVNIVVRYCSMYVENKCPFQCSIVCQFVDYLQFFEILMCRNNENMNI